MGVIRGFCSPWSADDDAAASGRLVDRNRAALFLRAQSSWLRLGLGRADDPTAVGIVLGAHDASHESWLALIAALEAEDAEAAERVSALYWFHGRVVGSLERGADRRLGADALAGVRSLLAAMLGRLTEEAVARLGVDPVGVDGAAIPLGVPRLNRSPIG